MTPMTEGDGEPHRDGSRKAAVYLLALLHEARRDQSPTSPVSHRHPTVAPGVHRGPSTSKRGDPFEEAKFEEAKTWPSLPSLHQVHSLFDAVACATNTHPSRVPPLVTAAMILLSRASAGQSRHLIPGLPPQQVVLEQSLGRLRSSGGAAQYADAAALGPAGALRGSTTLVLSGSNWRLLLLSALSIASKYMDDDHLCFVQLIRMHASHVLKPPLRTARAAPWAPLQGAPGRSLCGCPTLSRTS